MISDGCAGYTTADDYDFCLFRKITHAFVFFEFSKKLIVQVFARNVFRRVVNSIRVFQQDCYNIRDDEFISLHLGKKTHHRITDGVNRRNQCFPIITFTPDKSGNSYFEVSGFGKKKMEHIDRLIRILVDRMENRRLSAKSVFVNSGFCIDIRSMLHEYFCTSEMVEFGTDM